MIPIYLVIQQCVLLKTVRDEALKIKYIPQFITTVYLFHASSLLF